MQDEHVRRSTRKMTRKPLKKTGRTINTMQPREVLPGNGKVRRREPFHLMVQGRSLEGATDWRTQPERSGTRFSA